MDTLPPFSSVLIHLETAHLSKINSMIYLKYVDEKRDPFGEIDKKDPSDNAVHRINNSEEETRVKKVKSFAFSA